MSRGRRDEGVEAVERAMIAIRRSQSRRSLARLAGAPASGAAFEVLDVVEAAEQDGVPVTVSGVAAALNVDQPRASKLVAAAVEAGLVRRESDQADGRRTLLVRTERGQRVSEEIHRFRRSIFSAAMADWTDADRARFAELLTAFVRALAERTR
jgi:DNA-binding MarR family transcriptional regulator